MSRVSGGELGSSLFHVHEPRRRFLGPFLLVAVLHTGVVLWASRAVAEPVLPAKEPVKVVLKLPVRKVAVREPPGGGPPPPVQHHRTRRLIRPPKEIPPPVVEMPPQPEIPDPPKVAEAEEAGDDPGDEAEPGSGGGGGGSGTGSGPGTGPGRGSIASRARMAWLTHTDWRCHRPGHEDLGRIVVRIRVEVEPDGKPRQVTVVRPGPEEFNRRAIDCARDESYVPALDAEGRPIPGSCEFAIEFLN
jgi:outer membrane biosynthesis protein TonB